MKSRVDELLRKTELNLLMADRLLSEVSEMLKEVKELMGDGNGV